MTITTDTETAEQRAYHAAEGNVTGWARPIGLFADDGMFHTGQNNRRF